MNPETRQCQNCKNQFTIESEDFDFYKKIEVPPPTFCPDCRRQRRLLFRNERSYYRRACDLCKRNIISVYPAGAIFPVYCQKCWWGDGWDPFAYGREYDLSRSFFEQYQEFVNMVPHLSIMNDDGVGSVNSEYSYDWAFSKNVYMCVCGWHVENALYSYYLCYDKDVADCFFANNGELLYQCVNCDRSYNSKYCTLCFDCTGCVLSLDLRGCSDCVMSVGLRNKKYCIFNVEYSKEEYEKKVAELELHKRSSIEKLLPQFKEFALKFPRKFAYNLKTVNSTGDILVEVKNSKDCFYIMGPTENCRYIVGNDKAKDSYDVNNTGNMELCYECITPDNSRGNKFSVFCWKCVEAEYSDNCHSSTSVFGCSGLKHASYAILNKRYSKEEFIELRGRIVAQMRKTGEYGEFFPKEVSPFAYNETASLEWFPLTKEQALAKGYQWKEFDKREYAITKTTKDLPDTIEEVSESFVNEVVACAHDEQCNELCTKAFRIAPQELDFYRRMNIPLPALCPNCRHYARLKIRNPAELHHRQCQCVGKSSENGVYVNTAAHSHSDNVCPNKFETSYAPDPRYAEGSGEASRPEIVYCEECYNAEIV